jgi:branched-chain amino acid transport system substrate-binding protein
MSKDVDLSGLGQRGIGRRPVLKGIAAGGALLTAPLIARRALAANKTIKIGYVSPSTGPLAPFAAPDDFILAQVRKVLEPGLLMGGKTYPVTILHRDSESNPNRAAAVASDLILGEKVDLLTSQGTSATNNPVADQAELNGVPCVSTNGPWQSYFFGRRGDPKVGFEWTYDFFWGLELVVDAYIALWDTMKTNRKVGALFGNDATGNAWADPKFGLPPALEKAGYKLVMPGRYQDLTSDFTAQINAFKAAGVDIVTGNMLPPDFTTFWTQAAQQGLTAKIVTIGKALLFPSSIKALGARGNGLSSEIWWTPTFPFKSGLTGQTPAQLCDAYTKATGHMWTQPLGYQHALFEVAVDVLKRTADVTDPKSILHAIATTNYHSIVGHIEWTGKPVKNVALTAVVAGQWHVAKDGKLDLVICENKNAPEIPIGGKLQPI